MEIDMKLNTLLSLTSIVLTAFAVVTCYIKTEAVITMFCFLMAGVLLATSTILDQTDEIKETLGNIEKQIGELKR